MKVIKIQSLSRDSYHVVLEETDTEYTYGYAWNDKERALSEHEFMVANGISTQSFKIKKGLRGVYEV